MNPVVRERFRRLLEMIADMDKARQLQAKEYERRLEALNHEADRIKASQEKSISVEKFEGVINQMNERFNQTIAGIHKDINDSKEFRNKYQGRSAWTQMYIPWGISIILAILLALISYYQVRKEL